MTKEECEKALETIGDWSLWDSERTESGMWKVKDASCDEYKVIEKLINEHFDNPPLKFGDLKEGMWVWDDREKKYEKIHNTKLAPHVLFGRLQDKVLYVIDLGWCLTFFREDRFYQRQKE